MKIKEDITPIGKLNLQKKKTKNKREYSNINSNSEDVKELQKEWAWAISREVTAVQISHIHSKIQFRGVVYAKSIPFC